MPLPADKVSTLLTIKANEEAKGRVSLHCAGCRKWVAQLHGIGSSCALHATARPISGVFLTSTALRLHSLRLHPAVLPSPQSRQARGPALFRETALDTHATAPPEYFGPRVVPERKEYSTRISSGEDAVHKRRLLGGAWADAGGRAHAGGLIWAQLGMVLWRAVPSVRFNGHRFLSTDPCGNRTAGPYPRPSPPPTHFPCRPSLTVAVHALLVVGLPRGQATRGP